MKEKIITAHGKSHIYQDALDTAVRELNIKLAGYTLKSIETTVSTVVVGSGVVFYILFTAVVQTSPTIGMHGNV